MICRKAHAWVKSVFWNDSLPCPTTSSSHHPDKKEGGGNYLDIISHPLPVVTAASSKEKRLKHMMHMLVSSL